MKQDFVGNGESVKAGRIIGRVVLNFETAQ
jgi:hypothetical protein